MMSPVAGWSLLLFSMTLSGSAAWAGGGQGFGVSVPEPTSLALLSTGITAVLLYRSRRGPKK
jgi:PEP-CTERM motif